VVPDRFWDVRENRQKAINWLIGEVRKSPEELIGRDLERHGLGGLLAFYQDNIEDLRRSAGISGPKRFPNLKQGLVIDGIIDERAASRTGRQVFGHWHERANRVEGTRKVVAGVGDPRKVSYKDFVDAGLSTIVDHYPSIHAAIAGAGYDINPWEMVNGTPPHYWDARSNRCKALNWLLERSGKGPLEIAQADFKAHGLMKLYWFYRAGRRVKAEAPTHMDGRMVPLVRRLLFDHDLLKKKDLLKDLGLIIAKRPPSRWADRKVRVEAIRCSVERHGGPRKVKFEDLRKDGLASVVYRSFGGFYGALCEAGYDIEAWEMAGLVPKMFWSDAQNRRRALRWAMKRARTRADDVSISDLERCGLLRLAHWYSMHPSVLLEKHTGRLSSKAPLIKRILVREGLLKGDGLYGGTALRGDRRRRVKGYERHWVPRKERPVRTAARGKIAPKARAARKGRTVWKVTREKGKARIRNF